MKLSEYAKKHSISYQTAWVHFKAGKISGAYQLHTGTVVIPEGSDPVRSQTVVYARVSSSENKSNLESQANRVAVFCSVNGWTVDRIIKECGSGLDDSRKKLIALIKDPTVQRIVVEHKDRLTRFGFKYIETLFGGEIVVINKAEDDKEDLIQDFTSLVTSFCARIYGKRRSMRQTEKLIKSLNDE